MHSHPAPANRLNKQVQQLPCHSFWLMTFGTLGATLNASWLPFAGLHGLEVWQEETNFCAPCGTLLESITSRSASESSLSTTDIHTDA